MKKIIILVVILIIICLSLFYLLNNPKKIHSKEEIKTIDIVDKIYNRINEDKDFLIYINNNYNDTLNKLDKILDNNDYNTSYWHHLTGYSYIVLKDLYNNLYENMDNVKIINSNNPSTLSFVGDISLADNWYIIPRYDEYGITGVLSSDILDIMKNSDVMVANSEFTVSNRGSKIPNKMYTFRAKPERLSIYEEMGVDLVTLANNHVYDYGSVAFNDMLDVFNEYDIPHIGAGHNIEEASKPYYFIVNGYKIAFVNANRSEKNILTPGATETDEGVFRCYDPTNMINLIQELRPNTDYIIAIIHYGKENSHELENEQISSSKAYIDAGADMVVGHHAHTLQGIEFYNHKPIIYNLGNFLFNCETIDTAIFQAVLKDGNFDYFMIPAIQNDTKTTLLEGDDKLRVINDINSYSVNAFIDEDCKITEVLN